MKPIDFGCVRSAELHHISDASTKGYGQCSYLRLTNGNSDTHCSLIASKSRVTPIRPITVPRLELTAAVLSVKMSKQLVKELRFENIEEYFWTDSKVVLGYLTNESRRFHVYVANQVQKIKEHSPTAKWKYIRSEENPADLSSRGVSAHDLVENKMWWKGPIFLQDSSWKWVSDDEVDVSPDDPKLKKSTVFCQSAVNHSIILTDRFSRFSSWTKAKKAVALCLRYIAKLKNPNIEVSQPLNVTELMNSEKTILRHIQMEVFNKEYTMLQSRDNVRDNCQSRKQTSVVGTNSSLYRLDPYLDNDGIIRVGGCLSNSNLATELKNPIILPRKHHITQIIIRHFHERTKHQGRRMTINEIRANGFWIIGCSSVVYSYISKSVKCRKFRGCVMEQKMADLPADRIKTEPPFTYCGVDLFGPWYIKEGRKDLKRYGVLFTCMLCRAIHLETANSLTTDSFINALRRFICLRGNIRQLRSDQGTNLIGAKNELVKEMQQIDQKRVHEFLLREHCDYQNFEFNMNTPSSSHAGGVWERQIRAVRAVLNALLDQASTYLDDETLRTFMCEATAIVNSGPLTTENLNDPHSIEPLTPNHLLTMKSHIVLPPPGIFKKNRYIFKETMEKSAVFVKSVLDQMADRIPC